MGEKPIVSVTYENERISLKNSLPYLKCVLRGPQPIYGRFMGFYVNRFLSRNNAGVRRCSYFEHELPVVKPPGFKKLN